MTSPLKNDLQEQRKKAAGCAGCKYLDSHYYCSYILIEDQRRNAKVLPGGGCAKKDVGARPRHNLEIPKNDPRDKAISCYINLGDTPPRWNRDAALECYNQGMNDTQIAEQIGVSRSTIRNWRKENWLPSRAN